MHWDSRNLVQVMSQSLLELAHPSTTNEDPAKEFLSKSKTIATLWQDRRQPWQWGWPAELMKYKKLLQKYLSTTPTTSPHYLHVMFSEDEESSADSYLYCFNKRNQQHLSPKNYEEPIKSGHYRPMVDPDVKRKGHWVTILTVHIPHDASEQEVHDKRVLVMLGEAMYTSYFYTYSSKVEPQLKQPYPFNQVEWIDACSDSARTDFMHTAISTADAAVYRKVYHANYHQNMLATKTHEQKLERRRINLLQDGERRTRLKTTIEGPTGKLITATIVSIKHLNKSSSAIVLWHLSCAKNEVVFEQLLREKQRSNLPPEDDSFTGREFLRARAENILQALSQTTMTEVWSDYYNSRSIPEWFDTIFNAQPDVPSFVITLTSRQKEPMIHRRAYTTMNTSSSEKPQKQSKRKRLVWLDRLRILLDIARSKKPKIQNRAFGKDYKDRKRAADPDWDEKENAKSKARDRKKQHEKTMQGGQQTLMGFVTKNANTKDIANDEDIADDEDIANTKPQPLKDITKTVNNNGRRPGLYHSAPEGHTTRDQECTKNVSRILPDLSARIPDHYTMAHGAVSSRPPNYMERVMLVHPQLSDYPLTDLGPDVDTKESPAGAPQAEILLSFLHEVNDSAEERQLHAIQVNTNYEANISTSSVKQSSGAITSRHYVLTLRVAHERDSKQVTVIIGVGEQDVFMLGITMIEGNATTIDFVYSGRVHEIVVTELIKTWNQRKIAKTPRHQLPEQF
ncbi:hypothetical protein LTR98_006076 [Exophiala xenobiotica]|nr:hypothetical protein LTR98_006076 [Exophiala xenobiotica]